ncbi:Small-subunit processome Utp11 [Penicillium macrosclerotiorum]|uniref:Small-subunit processome Utp11 n=1 Tax=Penicillium macrosclerotiorum TaxID=303699 RepID=UPI0025488B25|nr:Small-subunit processome Utp11 [Penicillium macrosclerotiorum]KAJ5682678.1 Small-subunit processome Utp11 [Penicillium macrosclerotiorum]
MSSLRNAVARRNHKERGQLEGRERWGILEKHKDYSLRAKDYNAKQAKLKRLQEKVRDSNPDEFAFGMVGAKNQRAGKHGRGVGVARDSAEARGLSHDAIKLLKTQDQNYLRTAGERIRREIERLEREAQLQEGMDEVLGRKNKKNQDEDEDELDGLDDDLDDFDFSLPPQKKQQQKSRKLVFADDRDDQRAMKQKQIQDEESDAMEEDEEKDASRPTRKTPKQITAEREALREARRAKKIRKRTTEGRIGKLTALRKQYAEIQAAHREVDWQRGKMDNSVGGTNKKGIQWKIRERKR